MNIERYQQQEPAHYSLFNDNKYQRNPRPSGRGGGQITGDISPKIQQPDIPNDLKAYFEQYRKRIQKHYKKFGISIMKGLDF